MSDNPELNRILADLAAGTIDTDEAQRRIQAMTDAPPPQQATRADEAADSSDEAADGEPDEARRSADDYLNSRAPFATFLRDTFKKVAETVESTVESVQNQQPTQGASTADPRVGGRGVERVVVTAVGRRVKLIGDPNVATAVVTGPEHTMRRTGNTLEIHTEGLLTPSIDGFSLVHPPRSLEDLKGLGLGKTLTVRVNPSIRVDAEVTGGGLSTKRLPRLGKIRVTAGSAKLNNVVEVADALVQAGNATISGPVSEGRSRVRIESGNLFLNLTPDANVSVRAEANLGLVSWPGEGSGKFDEYIVGNGAARLDIGVVMGHAAVRVKEEKQA